MQVHWKDCIKWYSGCVYWAYMKLKWISYLDLGAFPQNISLCICRYSKTYWNSKNEIWDTLALSISQNGYSTFIFSSLLDLSRGTWWAIRLAVCFSLQFQYAWSYLLLPQDRSCHTVFHFSFSCCLYSWFPGPVSSITEASTSIGVSFISASVLGAFLLSLGKTTILNSSLYFFLLV